MIEMGFRCQSCARAWFRVMPHWYPRPCPFCAGKWERTA